MSDRHDSGLIELGNRGLPLLTQFSEAGFVNCLFRIQEHHLEDNEHRLRLAAEDDGLEIAFDLHIADGIRGVFSPDMELIQNHVYFDGARFVRTGTESDGLISKLASLYGLADGDLEMTPSFSFTAIALHEDVVNIRSDLMRIKLFGNDSEDDDEEDYFESFINVDLNEGWVAWCEKDPDYRVPLIRALSSPGISRRHA